MQDVMTRGTMYAGWEYMEIFCIILSVVSKTDFKQLHQLYKEFPKIKLKDQKYNRKIGKSYKLAIHRRGTPKN